LYQPNYNLLSYSCLSISFAFLAEIIRAVQAPNIDIEITKLAEI